MKSVQTAFSNSFRIIFACVLTLISVTFINAQESQPFTLTADNFEGDKPVALDKVFWKYRLGDEEGWRARDFDDSAWEAAEGTQIKPETAAIKNWNGRIWYRLRLKIDENLAGKNLALVGTQRGATEVYLDGRKLAEFGKITDTEISEYNPGGLPIPFRFETAGEHVLVVRYASHTFADWSSAKTVWLTNGGIYPGFTYSLRGADDVSEVIGVYAFQSSMRIGAFFIGVLLALALLHFLLYLFYRVERANLFYSLYVASFALFLMFNNFIVFGHQPIFVSAIFKIVSSTLLAATFTALLMFLHVAFGRRSGKLFWSLFGLWVVSLIVNSIMLNNIGKYQILTSVSIGLSFTFSIIILVNALRERRSGAWILMIGLQCLMIGMLTTLLRGLGILDLPEGFSLIAEICIILGVPVAVSVYLARNFARTNRDLKVQLAQVEQLSRQQIEHERQAAELRAENERRAKELEEARQLQLSMLPKKLPVIPNLEIAAYMKPATEVGGDYYDFHVGADGTLTVAVGDATGHGLKAGSVVTAAKSLFRAFADEPDITQIFRRSSHALKEMNLRGLFMAMTILKFKDDQITISAAGMPSALIYRAANAKVEEISIKAMPLGSVKNFVYCRQEIVLAKNDCILLMSDGFPEMFNYQDEMLGFGKAAELLPSIAGSSPQEIINHLVKTAEEWANGRPSDDDVTFVVLKVA